MRGRAPDRFARRHRRRQTRPRRTRRPAAPSAPRPPARRGPRSGRHSRSADSGAEAHRPTGVRRESPAAGGMRVSRPRSHPRAAQTTGLRWDDEALARGPLELQPLLEATALPARIVVVLAVSAARDARLAPRRGERVARSVGVQQRHLGSARAAARARSRRRTPQPRSRSRASRDGSPRPDGDEEERARVTLRSDGKFDARVGDRHSRTDEALRQGGGAHRPHARRAAGRGLRLPGSQRRGQVDHDQDPARLPAPHRGQCQRHGPRRRQPERRDPAGEPATCPAGSRCTTR